MFRFRRYRVYLICAAVLLFLLLRMSRNSQWEDSASTIYKQYTHPGTKPRPEDEAARPPKSPQKEVQDGVPAAQKAPPIEEPASPAKPAGPIKLPELKTSLGGKGGFALPTPEKTADLERPLPTEPLDDTPATGPVQTPKPNANDIPNRRLPTAEELYPEQNEKPLHIQKPPGALLQESLSATSTIHWRKPTEHFPVPEESIIMLPTGEPKPIPKIQHQFKQESQEAKEQREWRLSRVKAEAQIAWAAYREYAWMHDELVPMAGEAKDPFCGWAATLVDSLDTLWLMGLHEEFDEAYQALNDIDFTTSAFRSEIPVFETTIRYLGGLLGAYDVTGGIDGKYPLLLDKAVELAEILMGVFDTPNRMPILYYAWKPAFASQPHRASTQAGVAEMGSLLLEFTRLAQITGRNKYYDAVARITNALEEFQDHTTMPGVFPEQLDISGCNRSATLDRDLEHSSAGAQYQHEKFDDRTVPVPDGYKPYGGAGAKDIMPEGKGKTDLEFQVLPGGRPGEPDKGRIQKTDWKDKKTDKRGVNVTVHDVEEELPIPSQPAAAAGGMRQREDLNPPSPGPKPGVSPSSPLTATGLPAHWDCVPQKITSGAYGAESYSMGGSQDSTYEYFPKAYALLGGLEGKYRTMHEKTVAAVKKHLLFRPMIKDTKREILFSAKVRSRGSLSPRQSTWEYEVTHLSCFLGGMFGLGGKLFGSAEDVEIGKKLADGCVWAYEVMPTGIMPEYAQLLPCESITECEYNQTAWYDSLDPGSSWRDRQLEMYLEQVEEWQAKKDELLKMQRRKKMTEDEAKWTMPKRVRPGSEPAKANVVSKRAAIDLKSEAPKASAKNDKNKEMVDQKEQKLEAELDLDNVAGHADDDANTDRGKIVDDVTPDDWESLLPPEPYKPQSHADFVSERIQSERIPPGFTSIGDRRYILRPEAIESVWYMYRITGDPIWQEKGWNMFRAIITACAQGTAHSAIQDVAPPNYLETGNGKPQATDSMESFWLAETLKYFYLLYSEPDVWSLDEWVFNTEAHPFRRPT